MTSPAPASQLCLVSDPSQTPPPPQDSLALSPPGREQDMVPTPSTAATTGGWSLGHPTQHPPRQAAGNTVPPPLGFPSTLHHSVGDPGWVNHSDLGFPAGLAPAFSPE